MLLPGERQIWIFVCVKARLSFHFCYDILVVTFLFQTEETLRNEETGMMIAAKDVIFLVPMLLCALLGCLLKNLNCQAKCNSLSKKTSKGDFQPKHLQGRILILLVNSVMQDGSKDSKPTGFWQYSRINPLVFSLVPRPWCVRRREVKGYATKSS